MRPLQGFGLLLLVAALFITGCSSNNKGKLEGTKWRSQATTVKGIPLPAGSLQLEFSNDGKLVYRVGGQMMTGTYSLGMGDNVNFHMDQNLAGRKDHTEKIVVNGNQLTMTDSDGTTLTFTKS
ncbi:MAG: hypothetical protein IT429_06175 [Gemmataceae bacterium]|nr:hypothetical protein [Gemmataceae bacterium]